MSGALAAQQHLTNATSSSRDAELSKRNRRWSLIQVAPSSLERFCYLCWINIIKSPVNDQYFKIIRRHFQMQQNAWLFFLCTVNYKWNYTILIGSPFSSWDGPPAILYFNFDTLTGVGLMAENGTSNYDALVPGKVNRCFRWGKVESRYIDQAKVNHALDHREINQLSAL